MLAGAGPASAFKSSGGDAAGDDSTGGDAIGEGAGTAGVVANSGVPAGCGPTVEVSPGRRALAHTNSETAITATAKIASTRKRARVASRIATSYLSIPRGRSGLGDVPSKNQLAPTRSR